MDYDHIPIKCLGQLDQFTPPIRSKSNNTGQFQSPRTTPQTSTRTPLTRLHVLEVIDDTFAMDVTSELTRTDTITVANLSIYSTRGGRQK